MYCVKCRFAENVLLSYASDLNSLMDPIPILRESKTIYQQYANQIVESEKIDTRNNEYVVVSTSHSRLIQELRHLREINEQQSAKGNEVSSLREEISRYVVFGLTCSLETTNFLSKRESVKEGGRNQILSDIFSLAFGDSRRKRPASASDRNTGVNLVPLPN